jgi:hypothetical protein
MPVTGRAVRGTALARRAVPRPQPSPCGVSRQRRSMRDLTPRGGGGGASAISDLGGGAHVAPPSPRALPLGKELTRLAGLPQALRRAPAAAAAAWCARTAHVVVLALLGLNSTHRDNRSNVVPVC